MTIVAGKIYVKLGKQKMFMEKSLEAMALARNAKGCLDFVVAVDPLERNRINVFERWARKKDLVAFRNDGPGDDLVAMIERIDVAEYSVR